MIFAEADGNGVNGRLAICIQFQYTGNMLELELAY